MQSPAASRRSTQDAKICLRKTVNAGTRGMCRVGYVVMALTHPELGRPRVKALPYGSSIPHIEVNDLRQFQIPRLQTSIENEIADGVEEAARLRDQADELETALAASAEAEVRRFVGGS